MGYLGLTHWSETGFFTEFTVCNEDFVKKPGFFLDLRIGQKPGFLRNLRCVTKIS